MKKSHMLISINAEKAFVKMLCKRHLSDKWQLFRVYKELLESNNEKENNAIFKWAKYLNKYVTKGDIHMAKEHMKRYSTSYIVREFTLKQ